MQYFVVVLLCLYFCNLQHLRNALRNIVYKVAHCSPRRKHRRLSPKSDNVLQNGRTVSVLYCVSCHDVCGRPKYHAVRLRVRLGSDKGIRRDQSTVQWWQTNYTDWWAAVTGAAASAAAADTSAGETGQITWQKLRLASRFHVTFVRRLANNSALVWRASVLSRPVSVK